MTKPVQERGALATALARATARALARTTALATALAPALGARNGPAPRGSRLRLRACRQVRPPPRVLGVGDSRTTLCR